MDGNEDDEYDNGIPNFEQPDPDTENVFMDEDVPPNNDKVRLRQ